MQLYITIYCNIALAQGPIRTYFRESLSHTILAIAGHCLLSSAAVEYSEQTSCQEGLRQPNSCPLTRPRVFHFVCGWSVCMQRFTIEHN